MKQSIRMRANAVLLLTAIIWGVAFVAQSVGMDYVGPFTFSSVRNLIGGKQSIRMRANAVLLLTAIIWGVAFVAQSVGMDYVGPFTFSSVRNLIGGVVLLPCIALLDRLDSRSQTKEAAPKNKAWPILGGVCCGVSLAVSEVLQQFGIARTSVGKAGFLTAMYILIVPLLGLLVGKRVSALGLLVGKRVSAKVWGAVALALCGMYLLCMTESSGIALGDLLVLAAAVGFSTHILIIDHFSPGVDCVRMSCIQFFTAGALCLIPMLFIEQPTFDALLGAWAPILYAGVLSSAVAYTLQVIGQKYTEPTVASLILSLESVVAALAGWVLLGERLSVRELTGCVLAFAAIILAQLPDRRVFASRAESVVAALAGWVLLGERLSVRELTGCVLAFAAIILAQLPDRRVFASRAKD